MLCGLFPCVSLRRSSVGDMIVNCVASAPSLLLCWFHMLRFVCHYCALVIAVSCVAYFIRLMFMSVFLCYSIHVCLLLLSCLFVVLHACMCVCCCLLVLFHQCVWCVLWLVVAFPSISRVLCKFPVCVLWVGCVSLFVVFM